MTATTLVTRLGQAARSWLADVLPEGEPLCCTCGSNPAAFEYRNACSEHGQWDWAQCADCHGGSDDHARWMRTLSRRRLAATR